MTSPIEPRRPPVPAVPLGDEAVLHGHATGLHAAAGTGGRLVTIETLAAKTTGVLHYAVRHSPGGFAWRNRGSGPAELARCLLVAVLRSDALCSMCTGTTVVAYDFERDVVEPYDPARHEADLAGRCDWCSDGLDVTPALYQPFKEDVVARWPQDDDWRITAGETRAWLARHERERGG